MRVLEAMQPFPFTDFTGHVWSKSEVDGYNSYTLEINRERWEPTRQFLLDQRNRYFKLVAGVN